jgi:3-methyladenine DNA glycosylase AlkD
MENMADPGRLAGGAHFGINTGNRFGLRMPQIRALAKDIGRDHDLALDLWQSGNGEARILATLIADVGRVDTALMDAWVEAFDSWDVCDQCCMNLFRRHPGIWSQIDIWAAREEEFVRRAAFALIAVLAVHAKKEPDSRFIDLLPLIEAHSDDDRNFVKKAVNWALRQIGKRNRALNAEAVAWAKRLQERDTRAANWIAADALRELQGDKVIARLKA